MKKLLSLVLTLALVLMSASLLASCGEESGPVPIVCGENGLNEICGVATLGVDYYSLGVKAGDMAADILIDGKNASEMKFATDPAPTLIVNDKVAEEIGFTIPESVRSRAGNAANSKVTRVDSALTEDGADFTIGILQLVQHVALDQCNDGFIDQLSLRLNAAGKTANILNKNASGEEANNSTIANNFVDQNVDLIYSIATSSSQAAVSAASEKGIPVLFNAVTDPVGAGLVGEGMNVTGVSDINPVKEQIELIKELLGKEDVNIGLLYTSSETNSVYQINIAKDTCNELGISFTEGTISDITELENAMIKLKNAGVDAIYIPTDNVLANGAATVHTFNLGE